MNVGSYQSEVCNTAYRILSELKQSLHQNHKLACSIGSDNIYVQGLQQRKVRYAIACSLSICMYVCRPRCGQLGSLEQLSPSIRAPNISSAIDSL
jgi:hypothetical protein